MGTLPYAFLSVCAAAHKTWPILYAHSPNIFVCCRADTERKAYVSVLNADVVSAPPAARDTENNTPLFA